MDLRRPLLRANYDPDSFGRASERIARFLGTGRFLVYMTAVVVVWVALNVLGPLPVRFDRYPFTFLTLVLSLQASYAAPLILLAQNRQDDRDRVSLDEDRARASRTSAETEYLARELASLRLAVGEMVTRDFLRSELERRPDRSGERERGDRGLDREMARALTKAVDKAVDRAVERTVDRVVERVVVRTLEHVSATRADAAEAERANGREPGRER